MSGTLYAKNGGSLTLTVTTSSDTKCVEVSGAFADKQTSATAKSTWSFSFTAGAGDGTRTVTAAASPNFNANNCTGQSQSPQNASFVLDNTAPALTAGLSPAPNAAGWNHGNVTITWSSTDGGSGVSGSPTPATDSVITDTPGATKTASATDRVGNTGTGSVVVKRDTVSPAITGSRSPLANANGWSNSDVTVSFNCSDALSGIKACSSSSTVTTSGTNQAVSGSATDNADNSASTTVSGINIDKVAPTLIGAPTTSPNAAGWYNGDVGVHWTCSDALSGFVSGACPSDSTITGEGTGLTASASVSDKAGNATTSTSAPAVKIDRTAPTTSISGGGNAWTNTNVTVTLTPSDTLSGVASTSYSVDGGPSQSGTTFTLSTEGDHVVTYSSTDTAGNVETMKTAHVKIDKTAPTIGHSFTPTYTDGAWTNAAQVLVTFSCSDSGSGVASCTAPVAVTSEGTNSVHGTATDNATNAANDTATVAIDRTAPTVTATADRSANGNGWYNDDVTVTFSCADQVGLSGIAACPAAQTLHQGANQTATGTAHDAAGNAGAGSISGINIDTTAPLISGTAAPAPNGAGWNQTAITVTWHCSDALSGLDPTACPPPTLVSGEGDALSATASVTDRAGNTATGSVSPIMIDGTPPVTSATLSEPLPNGWYADHVHVTLTALDALSGVDHTFYSVDNGSAQDYTGAFDFTTPGTHTLMFWSVDVAGNTEDNSPASNSVTVKLDGIPPTITGSASPAANANGWNNTPVDVSFDCSDAESGIASCDGDTTLTADGADQSVTGTATDHGGNSSHAAVSGIDIDRTSPDLSGAATSAPNGAGWYNSGVVVGWTYSDNLSGIDAATVPADTTVTDEGDDVEAGPVSVSDLAGNSASASVKHLKIDRTAPTIDGAADRAPNAEGWYNADVTVAWTCDDTLSGVAPVDCPADSTISGEGTNRTAFGQTSDRAGNSASSTYGPIRIDQTAPSTDISAPSGWVNSAATVTFTPSDNLSGVAATHYTVNGGPEQTGTTAEFTAEGSYYLEVWSVDNAGNIETAKSLTVEIDTTAPTITHTQQPLANADGWNNSDVTITFVCADTGGSALKSCTEPTLVSTEGTDQPVPGHAEDNAGNTADDPATVSIDKTPPVITGAPDRDPNTAGWYDAPVTVTFTCTDQDALSGVKTCPTPVLLAEGADQSAPGDASDAAGNTSSTSVQHINIDVTPPTISGAATTSPNANGWYDGDVTVHWTCSDALSGVPTGGCPDDSVINGEGLDQSASATVYDVAGNSASATVDGIDIDRTKPVTSAVVGPPDSVNGWYAGGVSVTLSAQDPLSGVDKTYYSIDGASAQEYGTPFVEGLEGVHTVTFWSVDQAGNLEDAGNVNNTITIRVDTTDPTISGSRTPDANANGWNNTPVMVTFTCADPGGSGVETCGPTPQTVGEGGGQTASGTATDKVGNSAGAGVSDINVDLTAPSLSGAATTPPNGAGWYQGDVTVHWTCGDSLSGLDGPCPGDSAVSGEGLGLKATQSVTDLAGNSTTSDSPSFDIDRTPPTTSITAPSGWSNTGVDVDLDAHDNLSGVAVTHYQVDGGSVESGDQVHITTEGAHTIEAWSIDVAGNVETHNSATVRIDRSAPTISDLLSPEPNGAGWNNSDVTVTFTCTDQDNLSGIASCTSPVSITTETSGHQVHGEATDNAGNSATDDVTVKLDRTKPTISAAADRPANANGWYDDDVTVTFTCGDTLSGVASCSVPATIGEGADQHATGSVLDAAGNSDTAAVTHLNVDKTAPVVTGTATTAPNGAGWYKSDVSVHWQCSDTLSGIDGPCPADSSIAGDGAAQSASVSVSDRAGNGATGTLSGINIDRLAPVTSASAPDPDYPNNWYSTQVSVTLTATDSLSGVAKTYYALDGGAAASYTGPVRMPRGVHTLTYWSKDVAGNVESTSAGHMVTIKVDDIPPSITGAADRAPNADGWYNAAVTVSFACSDGQTALASCSPATTLTGNAANQSVQGSATDAAGNTATTTVGPINIDKTAPSIAAFTGKTQYKLGESLVVPTCQASDGLSGLAGCSVQGPTGSGPSSGNGVGDFVYTLNASDKAGNSATQTVTLHVGYSFLGFTAPVGNPGHDVGSASAFKAGSTVPMKFSLTNVNGLPVQSPFMPVWLAPVDLGTTSTSAAPTSSAAAPTVGGSFKWDATARQYVFTWQTPKSSAGHYFRVGVQLDSGDVYTTIIVLT